MSLGRLSTARVAKDGLAAVEVPLHNLLGGQKPLSVWNSDSFFVLPQKLDALRSFKNVAPRSRRDWPDAIAMRFR